MRRLKVGWITSVRRYRTKRFPLVRLKGAWVSADLGWQIGDSVELEVNDRKEIVIRKVEVGQQV